MGLICWDGTLLCSNGGLACSLNCCCGGDVVSTCGCANLPRYLYVYDASDDSYIATLVYVATLTNAGSGAIPPNQDGWEATDYSGGTLEFYCTQPLEGDTWNYDDEEGGTASEFVAGCTGTLATFTGIATGSGSVYVSTV